MRCCTEHHTRSVRPMTHGSKIPCTAHDAWRTNFPWVMGCAEGEWVPLPMGHGLYRGMFPPWVMGRTEVCSPMGDGLYRSTFPPWVMVCTEVHSPHGSWAVQRYSCPMHHGLYRDPPTPCIMDCTEVCSPHGSWVIQKFISSVHHGLYRGPPTPCIMDCTVSSGLCNSENYVIATKQ